MVLVSVRKKERKKEILRGDIQKNVWSPEIQYENSLYRLNELCIKQSPLF